LETATKERHIREV